VSLRIDKKTGLLSRESGRTSRFEYFEKDSAPKQYLQEEVPNLFNDSDPNEELATDEELF
jgi:penicillin-binding protein 1A